MVTATSFMQPSRKKRKDPPPNHTLLDFFPSPDAVKRTRVGSSVSQQPPSGVQRTKVASREIIIIDSDSDDSAHGKESGITSARFDLTRVSEAPQSLDSAVTHPGDKALFGVPSALLRHPNPPAEMSNSESQAYRYLPGSPGLGCSDTLGVSTPMQKQVTLSGDHMRERCQTDPIAAEKTYPLVGNSSADPPVEFCIGEWAAGDDELVALEALDNTTGVDEAGGESLGEQHFCPVCGTPLTELAILEVQAHVNQCLDMTTLKNGSTYARQCPSASVSIKSDVVCEDNGANTSAKDLASNLYSVLMNSRKEDDSWVEADIAADREFRPGRGNRRKAPFYKVLQGMPIAVDAFCYGTIPGVTAYFLTHAHSDHYTNLGSKWKSGPIYCSEETARLIMHMLSVDPIWVHPLPLDTPTIIPDTGGVSVTLIEANHCPGSCLFLFEGKQTVDAGDSTFTSPSIGSSKIFRYLHCGDFRASPRHVFHPAVKGKYMDHVYLDTTYLDPKYTFSPQPLVISACAELARRLLMVGVGDSPGAHTNRKLTMDAWVKPPTPCDSGAGQMPQDRTLVIVGTYSVGKERIVKAIAQALGTKIYCDSRKAAILRCQADKELHDLLTANPIEANVHILPLGTVTSDNLRSYLQRFKGTFSKVVGFRPTGWIYSPPSGSNLNGSIQYIISQGQSRQFSYTDLQPSQKSTYDIQIFGVPYSEHSSFFELTCFAMSCDWGRMIPTVNVGSPTSRAKMTKWLKRWESERKSTKRSIIQPRTADYW